MTMSKLRAIPPRLPSIQPFHVDPELDRQTHVFLRRDAVRTPCNPLTTVLTKSLIALGNISRRRSMAATKLSPSIASKLHIWIRQTHQTSLPQLLNQLHHYSVRIPLSHPLHLQSCTTCQLRTTCAFP